MVEEVDIITALCDRFNLCTKCYRDSQGSDCTNCKEYYLDCECTPLTPGELVNGYDI